MWEIMLGLLVGTAVSGVVPIVNAEILVAGVALAAPELGVPTIALVASSGQMVSKTVLFGVARWVPARLPTRAHGVLERASRTVSERGGAANSTVFLSAAVGLPPFYGISLAAGTLRMDVTAFLLSGIAGRTLRFGAIAWATRYLGQATLPGLVN